MRVKSGNEIMREIKNPVQGVLNSQNALPQVPLNTVTRNTQKQNFTMMRRLLLIYCAIVLIFSTTSGIHIICDKTY
jgi:hypothetical protein